MFFIGINTALLGLLIYGLVTARENIKAGRKEGSSDKAQTKRLTSYGEWIDGYELTDHQEGLWTITSGDRPRREECQRLMA